MGREDLREWPENIYRVSPKKCIPTLTADGSTDAPFFSDLTTGIIVQRVHTFWGDTLYPYIAHRHSGTGQGLGGAGRGGHSGVGIAGCGAGVWNGVNNGKNTRVPPRSPALSPCARQRARWPSRSLTPRLRPLRAQKGRTMRVTHIHSPA